MKKITIFLFLAISIYASTASASEDKKKVIRAVKDYIEAQIEVKPELMKRALHPEMKKRTFWQSKQGREFLMETSLETMMRVAATYNQNGDRFSDNPKIKIEVFDIDQRVASAKLTVKDWIDYMHLVKNKNGEWQVVNVLWQYHDTEKHQSKK